VRLAEAPSYGKPVLAFDKKSKVRKPATGAGDALAKISILERVVA
jgi:hypothetical protein